MKNLLYPPPPAPPEPTGILPYDSKEFGLTYDEYMILVEDYERAIEEGNRKYGYGRAGYLDENGDYYLPSPTEQFIDHTLARRDDNKRRRGVKR
jgi:hypothetical protein